MSSQKLFKAVAAVALLTTMQVAADAQYYSGSYSTFYQPYGTYSTYYSGPTTAYYGGGGYGYTTYYGGSSGYAGNPFAPLVPSPYGSGWGGWFGRGYTAAYGGGCCSPCATGCSPCSTGCSPCGGGCGIGGCSTGGCATGNCAVPATTEQMKPSPDNGVPDNGYDDTGEGGRTFDENETPPMDDPNFRPGTSGSDESATGTFGDGINSESFKIPMDPNGLEVPEGTSQPENPIDADKPEENDISVPEVQFDLHPPTNRPISPRNSAQVRPATHLDRRITWRSRPVIVPQRQQLAGSRPLIVRKTVKVQLNAAPTLVSQSNAK